MNRCPTIPVAPKMPTGMREVITEIRNPIVRDRCGFTPTGVRGTPTTGSFLRASCASAVRLKRVNLLLLGKGKTGALVAETAAQRGHMVSAVDSSGNRDGQALTPDSLRLVDVVIDFTTPESVIHNITAVAHAKKNMVVGTTGWYQHREKVRELVEASGIGFVFGSNFSVGVNVFFGIAQAASAALKLGYEVKLVERHHTAKKDAPSGTARTIADTLQAGGSLAQPPEITSIREGDTVGTHVMIFDSPHDTMMLVHDAKDRRGFAEGAIRAAEWVKGKSGFYEFKDVFQQMQ